jgi:hypothetical protein
MPNDFREFMAAVGYQDPDTLTGQQLRGLLSDIEREGQQIHAAIPFPATTDGGYRFLAVEMDAHIQQVMYWGRQADLYRRKYDNLRVCSLLMIAALVVLCVVGWLS